MSKENVTNVTSALPSMDPSTTSRVKRGATIAAAVVGALLVADEGVKRLRRNKKVEVVVTDTTPES